MSRLPLPPAVVVACLLAFVALPAAAQEHADMDHDAPIEFSHPMQTESPSPDTKLRLDFLSSSSPDASESSRGMRLEGEYAFRPWVSLAVTVPYEWHSAGALPKRNGIASTEVSLKFASFAQAERGLLFGGGLSSEMPTGSDANEIGSGHLTGIEPFADVAWRRGPLELVAFTSYAASVGQGSSDADREWGTNLSGLWQVTTHAQALLELDTQQSVGANASGTPVTNVSPGIKYVPGHDHGLMLGASLRIPVSQAKEFNRELLLSVMYHF